MYTRSFSRHSNIPPDYAGVALREEADAARAEEAAGPGAAVTQEAPTATAAPGAPAKEMDGRRREVPPEEAEEEAPPFREAPRFSDTFRPVSEHTGAPIQESPPPAEPPGPPLGGSIDTADMLLIALAALITQGDDPDNELLMLLLLLLLTGK